MQPKYFNNNTNFAPGFVTPDDAWENRWRKGQNALLGWSGALPGSGNGAKSHGRGARQQRRIRAVPGREGVQDGLLPRAEQRRRPQRRSPTMTASFKANGYRLKQVFAEAAVYCMGD